MDEAVIETFDLTKVYGGRVRAVDRLNLRVGRGEVFGLLGPNGAGKTTTVRMLTTFIRPTSGSARVAGYDIVREADRVRRVIGYSSQEVGVDRDATGRENLWLFGRYHHLDSKALRVRVRELLELTGLVDVEDRLVKTYSSGMRKRLEIATALVHDPEILFLDEPTLGLDVQTRANIWDYIRRLRREGRTIILTTHYLEEADRLCDRLAIMDRGRVVALGAPGELKGRVEGDSVSLSLPVDDLEGLEAGMGRAERVLSGQPFVRGVRRVDGRLVVYVSDGDSAVPRILRLLEGEGVEVERVTLSRPSLDDVFLMCTGRTLQGAEEGGG